ncbi:hypothetical protein G5I_14009 [Acromyrmex echinatior]|uniref:Uncharacterized protein n=2 Tax=Attini TaxID=143999 RepID=F4X6P1_ACREC|nr:hypothetical protein G5I_14009 [Acromyrmex echinatior]
MTGVSNHSNSLSLYSSRPGRPPKRASVGLSLAASHLAAAAGHHPQHSLKKHRMDNGDYYENGHLGESNTLGVSKLTATAPSCCGLRWRSPLPGISYDPFTYAIDTRAVFTFPMSNSDPGSSYAILNLSRGVAAPLCASHRRT